MEAGFSQIQSHMKNCIADLKLSWIVMRFKRFDSDVKFSILLNKCWLNLVLKLADKRGAITTIKGILIVIKHHCLSSWNYVQAYICINNAINIKKDFFDCWMK